MRAIESLRQRENEMDRGRWNDVKEGSACLCVCVPACTVRAVH